MGTRIGIQGTKSTTNSTASASSRSRPSQAAPSRVPLLLWGAITAGWLLLISGLFEERIGTPGLLQVLRLRSFLAEKQANVQRLEGELAQIEASIKRIDESPVVLDREIRKTLGYVAPEDLIFDFTASESNAASGAESPGRE
jgi:cell division protein FtsB